MLFLLHGIGADARGFAPLINALSSRGIESEALNFPGYGTSIANPGSDTIYDLADFLIKQLDRRKLASASFLGHSLGGMAALELAATHPTRVENLVIVNSTPAFGSRDGQFQRDFITARTKPLDDGLSMRQMAEKAVPHLVGADCSDAVQRQAIDTMARVREATFRQALTWLTTFDRRDALPAMEMPVLAIAGSEDTNAPAKTMRKMAEALPNGRYEEIVGGHLLPVEAPEAIAALVAAS